MLCLFDITTSSTLHDASTISVGRFSSSIHWFIINWFSFHDGTLQRHNSPVADREWKEGKKETNSPRIAGWVCQTAARWTLDCSAFFFFTSHWESIHQQLDQRGPPVSRIWMGNNVKSSTLNPIAFNVMALGGQAEAKDTTWLVSPMRLTFSIRLWLAPNKSISTSSEIEIVLKSKINEAPHVSPLLHFQRISV